PGCRAARTLSEASPLAQTGRVLAGDRGHSCLDRNRGGLAWRTDVLEPCRPRDISGLAGGRRVRGSLDTIHSRRGQRAHPAAGEENPHAALPRKRGRATETLHTMKAWALIALNASPHSCVRRS